MNNAMEDPRWMEPSLEMKEISLEKAHDIMDRFSGEEKEILDTVVPPWRGAKIESRDVISQQKRWKKAVLSAVTLMATMWSIMPDQARAEGLESPGTKVLLVEGGKVRIEVNKNDTYYIADAPETDPEKIKINAQKARALDSIIENKDFEDNITYLESKYGFAINGFLSEVRADHRALLLEKDSTDATDKNELDLVLAAHYDLYWNKQEIIARADATEKTPRVDGFEKNATLSNEKIQGFLNGVPRNLINQVDEIRYVDAKKTAVNYTIAGDAESVGLSGVLLEKGKIVNLYDTSVMESASANEEARRVFYHEVLGHENDWTTSDRLTMPERLEMLIDVTKRVEDPTRPRNTYIDETIPEEYRVNGWSAQEMELRQATEFWAVAVENCRDIIKSPDGKAIVIEASPLLSSQQATNKPHIENVFLGSDASVSPKAQVGESSPSAPNPTERELVNKWLSAIVSGK